MRSLFLSVVLGLSGLGLTLGPLASSADAQLFWRRGWRSDYYYPTYTYSYPAYSYYAPTYSYYTPGYTTEVPSYYSTPYYGSYYYTPGVSSYYSTPSYSYYPGYYGYYRRW